MVSEEKRAGDGETAFFPVPLSCPFTAASLRKKRVIMHAAPSLPTFKNHLHFEKERAVSVRQRL